jgi:hypothetical protein
MSKKNPLEKTCPECEEEMDAVYDKNKVLLRWECSECGTTLLVTNASKQTKP